MVLYISLYLLVLSYCCFPPAGAYFLVIGDLCEANPKPEVKAMKFHDLTSEKDYYKHLWPLEVKDSQLFMAQSGSWNDMTINKSNCALWCWTHSLWCFMSSIYHSLGCIMCSKYRNTQFISSFLTAQNRQNFLLGYSSVSCKPVHLILLVIM